MTKSEFDKIIAAGKAAGLEKYVVRCEGGNRVIYHKSESSLIYPKDTYLICFELSRNYASKNGQFNIIMVPYDDIDTVKFVDVPFVEGLAIMNDLGCKDDQLLEFVKTIPRRQEIYPGTGGIAPITEKRVASDGTVTETPIINGSVPGYITK